MSRGPSSANRDLASIGRAATAHDVPAVTACLTSAFFDDPLWGQWAFPEQATRSGRLYQLMNAWASAGVRHPWVRMTDSAEAVAVWLPPGEPEMTSEQERAFEVLVDRLLGERASDLQAILDLFEKHHPMEPHYYLSLWATHGDHAGRGLGTMLIQENLARIDSERMPAYLESTNPANLSRYEALGFDRRDEFGHERGPVIPTMARASLSQTSRAASPLRDTPRTMPEESTTPDLVMLRVSFPTPDAESRG